LGREAEASVAEDEFVGQAIQNVVMSTDDVRRSE
jgi:hypothetical protein